MGTRTGLREIIQKNVSHGSKKKIQALIIAERGVPSANVPVFLLCMPIPPVGNVDFSYLCLYLAKRVEAGSGGLHTAFFFYQFLLLVYRFADLSGSCCFSTPFLGSVSL